jgi:hypothetical protein
MLCLVQQVQLGDLVISVETSWRQAEERGPTLLDEMRILMVSTVYFTYSIAPSPIHNQIKRRCVVIV